MQKLDQSIRVAIWQPRFPDYRYPFFEELANLGKADSVEYKFYAPISKFSNLDRENLPSRNADYVRMWHLRVGGKCIYFHPRGKRFTQKADLLVIEHALSNVYLLKLIFVRKIPYLLWGHGKTYSHLTLRHTEPLRRRIIWTATGYLVYTVNGMEYLKSIGFAESKIQILYNSTDVRSLRKSIEATSKQEVIDYCAANEIPESAFRVAFLGSLIPAKGIEMLEKVALIVRNEISDFQILIYGEGVNHSEENFKNKHEKGLLYLGIADRKTLSILPQIIKMLFIPKGVGLVAVDSLAMGKPLLTKKDDGYAPEFSYLIPGRNSLLCDYNPMSFALEILRMYHNPKLLEFLSKNCIVDSDNFSIQKMAKSFHEGVLKALELKSDHESY